MENNLREFLAQLTRSKYEEQLKNIIRIQDEAIGMYLNINDRFGLDNEITAIIKGGK